MNMKYIKQIRREVLKKVIRLSHTYLADDIQTIYLPKPAE